VKKTVRGDRVKIFETVCGGCGAKDSLVPVRGEGGVWRCEACGEEFTEVEG
jgi:ribosomal protein L37AE/L43A